MSTTLDEQAEARRKETAPGPDVTSLRSALEFLKSQGDLLETDVEVDPDLEVTGLQKHLDGGPVLLFNKVKGKPHARVITNLFRDINVVDKMFSFTSPMDRTRRIARAMNNPLRPVEVPGSEAPVQQEVLTAHYRDEKPIPLTMCFGVPPACTLVAGGGFDYVILPKGCDELGVAGAVQGSPVNIVKARTVDAYAIAESEYVLEGYLYPRDKRYETAEAERDGVQGKHFFHPEWAGYMGKAYKATTFHVTAITMRKPETKPLIYLLGVHMADCNNIDTTLRESAIFELCERLQPGIVQDVHIPFCMTDWGGVIIQVRKRNKIEEGWQRNFLAAILSCSQGMRLAIAVSPDVDIYSMDDIMWCLTTRVNPHTDILNPLPGGIGQTFQPQERMTAGEREWTASNTRFEGGMGIDATVPFGYEQDFHRPVYPIDKVDPLKFFSQAELDRAKERMHGWVEVLARTGR